MLKKRLIISPIVFIFIFAAGVLGFWLKRGYINSFQVESGLVFSALFSIIFFFILDKQELRHPFFSPDPLIATDPSLRKIKQILGLITILLVVVSFTIFVLTGGTAWVLLGIPLGIGLLCLYYVRILSSSSVPERIQAAKKFSQTITTSDLTPKFQTLLLTGLPANMDMYEKRTSSRQRGEGADHY